jgi:FtsH-binding integral membrane protein
MYEPSQEYYSEPQVTEREVAGHLAKVMGWMCVGLLTTFAVAVLCYVPAVRRVIFSNQVNLYVILFAQLGVVMALGWARNRLTPALATVLFMAYSALTGVTFSMLALLFELSSIVMVFGITAVVFFTMSLYGFITRRDLTRVGSIAVMALVGVLLATLVNMFLQNAIMDYIVSLIGLAVFIALTAYDVQKIKAVYMGATVSGHGEESDEVKKLAIFGALSLYLDFINIFLYLLRLFGKRR